jgi:hypothetical protein
VTTRRRTLRPLSCPLEPELIVAEFAEELPPDIAQAVREHVAVCEVCSARAVSLRGPYELLASLGDEPVAAIPDLRESVQTRARAHPALRAIQRASGSLGRNGVITLTAFLGLGLVVFFVTVVFLLPASAQTTSRSTNGLTKVAAAGKSGLLLAETGKLVTVSDSTGTTWQVAEIIAADQRNGHIVRSLPASDDSLHVATTNLLPVSVRLVGNLVAELTVPNAKGEQALVVFDVKSGAVKFVTRLTLPGGKPLPGPADALALAPNASVAYIGIPQVAPTQAGARVLVLDLKTGKITGTRSPGLTSSIPLPPPPGSLPASAFPTSIPHLNASGMVAALGLNGALTISPDGQWLYDVVTLTNSQGAQWAVVRRFSAQSGALAQALAIPGTFSALDAQLMADTSTQNPQIYLVRGSPSAEVYILDATAQGPTLIGDVPLGGPVSPPGLTFTGSLVVAPAPDGTHLDIGQDVTRSDGNGSGHDLWTVDTVGMSLLAHEADPISAGALLPNPLATGSGNLFLLRSGQVELISTDLASTPAPWIRLSDGHDVVALLATSA